MNLSHVRHELLSNLRKRIIGIKLPHPVRVAVNGIDAAGKSTLADELADFIRQSGCQVVRASIDGFHNPKSVRYKRGKDSPEGFYLDSFDIAQFIDVLLRPLGPNGNLRYRTQVYDYISDSPKVSSLRTASKDAILIVDGIFLFRPDLMVYWDYSIFLHVSNQVALERALKRSIHGTESREELIERYHKRYLAGQQIYLEECKPDIIADVVIDNNDLGNPKFVIFR